MHLKVLTTALLFAVVYMLLLWTFVGYAASIDIPAWWYPTFGRTGPSAIAWMQVVHSVGVLAAAVPVAAAIAYFFPQQWLRITLIAAGFAMAAILYDAIRGYYLVAQLDAFEMQPRRVVSPAIDVVKVGLLLLLAVWGFRHIVPSNNALERP